MKLSNALSFNKSQNVLGWSKSFLPVPDQKFIYILWQSLTFVPDKKMICKILFCVGTKVFEEALNAVKFLGCFKKFGPAQNTYNLHTLIT
jgi:hypothetical protein